MQPYLVDLLLATFFLGLPLAALSWFLFGWLFSNGDLDRELDTAALRASIKKLKKSSPADPDKSSKTRMLYNKWMWFGSGFYGLAGFWTFLVIEFGQAVDFITDFSAWGKLTDAGMVSFLVNFAINQLGNLLQGLVWFTYWPAESTPLWMLVAFIGYQLGLQFARLGKQMMFPSRWSGLLHSVKPARLLRLMLRLKP